MQPFAEPPGLQCHWPSASPLRITTQKISASCGSGASRTGRWSDCHWHAPLSNCHRQPRPPLLLELCQSASHRPVAWLVYCQLAPASDSHVAHRQWDLAREVFDTCALVGISCRRSRRSFPLPREPSNSPGYYSDSAPQVGLFRPVELLSSPCWRLFRLFRLARPCPTLP